MGSEYSKLVDLMNAHLDMQMFRDMDMPVFGAGEFKAMGSSVYGHKLAVRLRALCLVISNLMKLSTNGATSPSVLLSTVPMVIPLSRSMVG